MITHGSLCSGYDGIGLALEAELGAELAYVCDYDKAPGLVLAHHYPDVDNHVDLKALTWAKIPVKILSAGYPCQPFSGAGKRLGTEDPRHLWPWISKGIALSRPPMVLLENVRGHLTLGWDVVLLDLHRLGYDVRWTLLRAADVGACHGRARLYAIAADRDVHTWEPSSRMPDRIVSGDTFAQPNDGLFGAVLMTENLPSAGLMIDGVVWDQAPLLGGVLYELLPTPTVGNVEGGNRTRSGARSNELLLPGVAEAFAADLLPTPSVTDMGIRKTPEEWDVWVEEQRAKGINGNGHGPSLEIEAARVGEVLFRTPTAQLAINGGSQHPDKRKEGGHGPTLADEVEWLLPTPNAAKAGSDMTLTCSGDGREVPNKLGWAISDLLPTPVCEPETGNGHARNLSREVLLPTPTTMDAHASGGGYNGQTNVTLTDAAVRQPERWGRYAAAVARHEAIFGAAPEPTLPSGKGGAQRLSPAFVEWMMMLPAGWVTDPAFALKRDAQLKLLGNGVVPAQAQAAVRHLLVGLAQRAQVAA